jgi:transposase
MKKTRRKFTSSFKTQVVLEALKERLTLQELSSKFEIHPNQITKWKKEFLDNADKAFSSSDDPDQKAKEREVEELYEKIGRLNMQVEWLKKKVL